MAKNNLKLAFIIMLCLIFLNGCGKTTTVNINTANTNENTNESCEECKTVDEPLRINQIVPSTVSAEGGTTITIFGSGFEEGVRVFIDTPGKSLINPIYINSRTLRIITPPHAEGNFALGVISKEGERFSLPPILKFE